MKYLSYDEIEVQIQRAPITWIPALLRVVVERAVQDNVFAPGGLVNMVVRWMDAPSPGTEHRTND